MGDTEKLPQLFEECITTPQAQQLPPQDATLSQLLGKVKLFREEFSKHIKEYQNSLQMVYSNVGHHQHNPHELVVPLQEQFGKDMVTTQSALQELSQARKLFLLTPEQIHKVHVNILALYNQELIVQFFQSELSSLLRGEQLKE